MKIGFITLHRSIQDHWVYNSEPYCKGLAWLDLILSAFHTKTKVLLGNELITVERGQLLTSELKLKSRWGWSKTKVRNYLNVLEQDNMIIKESDTKKTMITVCNYSKYQFSATAKEPAGNHSRSRRQLREDTNNNVNTFNNDKNFINVDDVINDFNEISDGVFEKQMVERLSEETKQLLRTAANFLNNNQVKFKEYFQLCKVDPFINGTKDPSFKANFQYLMKHDVIERVISMNSGYIESSNIDEVIASSELMLTIVETSDEATHAAKKSLINAVARAYECGYQDDEILSSLNARYLISRVQEIFSLINKRCSL